MSGPTPAPRVLLRPVATPLPLGFLGLVVAVSSFAAVHVGWVPATQVRAAAYAALFLTVPSQLTAAAVGFWARDPVAATGMGLQSGLWAVTSVVTLTSPPGSTNEVFGVVLVAIGVALLVPVVSGLGKPVAVLVFLGTATHSVVLAGYELGAGSGWERAAGVVGLGLAALALYAALAFELEGAYGRTLLPIGRRRAVVGQGEPGVRDRL